MNGVFQEGDIDILREMGNIGAGNAACSLERWLGRAITVSVPEAVVIPLEMAAEHIGDPLETVMGVYAMVSGEPCGHILYLLSLKDAGRLLDLILDPEDKGKGFTTHNLSAIAETGNILFSAYLDAISRLCGIELTLNPPSCTADMLGAIINTVLLEICGDSPSAVLIQTEFEGAGFTSGGHVLFLTDLEALRKLVRTLDEQT